MQRYKMDLKEQLKQVNDYLVSKIIKGECEMTHIDNYTISVKIEGYYLGVWVSNDGGEFVSAFPHAYTESGKLKNSKMLLEFTSNQKKAIFKKYRPMIESRFPAIRSNN